MENLSLNLDLNSYELLNKKIAAKISELSKGCGRLFDIGFGNCSLIEVISSSGRNCSYFGIDLESTTVELARAYISKHNIATLFSVEQVDILKFTGKSFDCCVCSRLFHHFSLLEAKAVLKSMTEIIDMNGRLIIADSIRDYRNRSDRNSYTPYFFLNEISALIGSENVEILPINDARLNLNQIWFLCVDIHAKMAKFSLHILNEV